MVLLAGLAKASLIDQCNDGYNCIIMLRNTLQRYGLIAQFFHWAVVGLIITQFVLAIMFSDMPLGMAKIKLIVVHKGIGMTILVLAVMRVAWKFLNPQPVLPNTLKRYERWLANLNHWGLYILIFALPVSGWIMSSLANIPVDYFGLFEFPNVVAASKESIPVSKAVHEILAVSLLVLVGVHLLAVIKHHFILKDDILYRMLPEFLNRK